jgi:Domain of unknown function (DUF3471)
MQMNKGKYGKDPEKQIFSEEVHREMWTPQTIIPVRGTSPYRTHFASYGLGWRLSDVCGYLQAGHTGSLMGVVTQVTLIPELKLGIIVFTNQQESAAFTAITNTILDSYFGIKGIDRIRLLKESVMRSQAEAKKVTDEVWAKIEEQQKNAIQKVDPVSYAGTYTDNWFGDVIISYANGHMRFRSVRSPKLRGEMIYYTGNTFIVKWDDRTLDADAYVVFCLDMNGRPSTITMEAISPLTDFSYDFQDLLLKRKE